MNTLQQHKKIILGRANRNEWLFFVDPNDHNEFMSEADGGVLQVCLRVVSVCVCACGVCVCVWRVYMRVACVYACVRVCACVSVCASRVCVKAE